MKATLIAAALLWAGVAAAQGAQPVVTFTYSNPALQPASYRMEIHEDGTAHYHSEPGGADGARAAAASSPDASRPQQPLDRTFVVGGQLRSQLFAAARKHHLFAVECALKKGNVAFTGDKTLQYSGPEGSGSCSFNYARDADLQTLAGELIAVSSTLEQGRSLALLLTHDKLGLDAAIGTLGDEQAGGRARELENVLPVLHAIAENPEVLNRTRARATALIAIGESSR